LRFPGFEGEWESKKLSEIAEIGRGKSKHRPRDAEFLFGGKYPFVQTGDIRKADLFLTQFTQTYSEAGLMQSKLWNENTLCITIAANIAETAILKIKACFPDSIIGLIPKKNETTVLFVKHLFDKFKIEIQRLSQGVAQDNLNQEKLSKIEFSFPKLVEQDKVTSFLSSIDERIATQNKIIEELKLLKNTLSKKIFSGQLKFKDESGNDFPEWRMKEVGEIFKITRGNVLAMNLLTNNWSEETPYPVYSSQTKIKGLAGYYNKFLFENAITWTTDGANAGDVNYRSGKFYCTNVCGVLLNKEGFANTCVSELINSVSKNYVSYVGNPKLMNGIMSKIKIEFPSLQEQAKIANFLSSIDTKIDVEYQFLQELKEQKKYLLANLFI
jgi:type I restriction enzyme S subunit